MDRSVSMLLRFFCLVFPVHLALTWTTTMQPPMGLRRAHVLRAKTSGDGYFKVVTDDNATVDAFGQSTWCDIAVDEECDPELAPLPPLDVCPRPVTPAAEERVFCSWQCRTHHSPGLLFFVLTVSSCVKSSSFLSNPFF